MATNVPSEQLRQINRDLSRRIYELHNVFKISLELTSGMSRDQVLFSYIVNIIGLMRANGAVLLLPDAQQPRRFVPAISRGFDDQAAEKFSLDASCFRMPELGSAPEILRPAALPGRIENNPDLAYCKKQGVELIAPFTNFGKIIGVVLIGKRVNGTPYGASDVELLMLVNNIFANVLNQIRLIERLEKLSTTDGLTRILNRRAFDEIISKEVTRSTRYESGFSLVLIDIDHFKNYNDTNGHQAGDALLRLFARLLQSSVRTTDVVARYGGEEFAVILLGVNKDGSAAFCDRFRKLITGYPFKHRESQPLGFISASFGVASCPADATSARQLIRCADTALYQAKEEGRNAVRWYQGTPKTVTRSRRRQFTPAFEESK